MNEPIDETYFNWLCAKVLYTNPPVYVGLMRVLYQTEFAWVVAGDQNRAEDGCELRDNFLRETQLRNEQYWYDAPCSVFEVLVALADRVSFQTGQSLQEWFWIFMANLGLDEYRQVSDSDVPIIEDILFNFVWRQYDSSGHGGIFPLRWPRCDQRKVELWYQFFDYLEDQGLD